MDGTSVLLWVVIVVSGIVVGAAVLGFAIWRSKHSQAAAPAPKNGHSRFGDQHVPPVWVERARSLDSEMLSEEQPQYQQEFKDLMMVEDSAPPITEPGKNGHGKG